MDAIVHFFIDRKGNLLYFYSIILACLSVIRTSSTGGASLWKHPMV